MDRSELKPGEPHPAAETAREYILSLGGVKLAHYAESFASCALSGNRLAEICAGTITRMIDRKPVSDRYFMGLAWAIKTMEEGQEDMP